jgi:hypothetical protein
MACTNDNFTVITITSLLTHSHHGCQNFFYLTVEHPSPSRLTSVLKPTYQCTARISHAFSDNSDTTVHVKGCARWLPGPHIRNIVLVSLHFWIACRHSLFLQPDYPLISAFLTFQFGTLILLCDTDVVQQFNTAVERAC